MHLTRVVILSSHSLFAEGVASRLRQHSGHVDLQHVDVRQPNALARVFDAQPSVVILDATDPDIDRQCPLGVMFQSLPALKVIRLDPQQDHVQVVTSEQRLAGEVRDLVDLIEGNI